MAVDSQITLKQMRALTTIHENGSLTAAAEMLGLTPPAVSTQLKQLEEHFATRLVMRGNDGKTSLTSAGTEVLRTARQLDVSLATCLEKVKAIRQGQSGFVSIGVVSTGKYFAPALVAGFREQHPEIEVSLRIGNREELVAQIMDGGIDVAIMGRPPRAPIATAEVLGPHPHILIAPYGHVLAQARQATATELLAETFLLRERGSGTRILLERYLDRIAEGQPYETLSMGSNETIKQAVMAGLGIALISAHTVAAELRDGRLQQVSAAGTPIQRQWFLVHRRDMPLTAVTERFRQYVVSKKGSYFPTAQAQ